MNASLKVQVHPMSKFKVAMNALTIIIYQNSATAFMLSRWNLKKWSLSVPFATEFFQQNNRFFIGEIIFSSNANNKSGSQKRLLACSRPKKHSHGIWLTLLLVSTFRVLCPLGWTSRHASLQTARSLLLCWVIGRTLFSDVMYPLIREH